MSYPSKSDNVMWGCSTVSPSALCSSPPSPSAVGSAPSSPLSGEDGGELS